MTFATFSYNIARAEISCAESIPGKRTQEAVAKPDRGARQLYRKGGVNLSKGGMYVLLPLEKTLWLSKTKTINASKKIPHTL